MFGHAPRPTLRPRFLVRDRRFYHDADVNSSHAIRFYVVMFRHVPFVDQVWAGPSNFADAFHNPWASKALEPSRRYRNIYTLRLASAIPRLDYSFGSPLFLREPKKATRAPTDR